MSTKRCETTLRRPDAAGTCARVMGIAWFFLCSALLAGATGENTLRRAPATVLEWDALEKSYVAKENEVEAEYVFQVKNPSPAPVTIREIRTSCRCTAGTMPRQPWVLEPGASDTLRVVVDLRGRRGGLSKTVYVDTTAGEELLLVHATIPVPPAMQREMNVLLAKADRQAVLRDDCASCHVTPAVGKMGGELFQAACQVCHGAEHRATMVPDLLAAPATRRDGAYWNEWVRNGKDGTMMPAWDKKRGGVFDDDQIESLMAFLLATLPSEPIVAQK